jgi:hypothetical protein
VAFLPGAGVVPPVVPSRSKVPDLQGRFDSYAAWSPIATHREVS